MVDTTPLVETAGKKEEKIGHKICGCCCDSRRAVLVYSILVLIFSIIGVISFVVSELFTTNYFRATLIISIVSIVVSVIVICGAIFYNMWLVGIGAVWTLIWIILSIVFALQRPEYVEWNSNGVTRVLYTPPALAIICAIIWGGLVLYPQITFIVELSKGIMTPETYKRREEQSCCCV